MVALLLVIPPVRAQRTRFNPRFSLSLFRSDNIDLLGAERRRDSGLTLGLALPVSRDLENGSLSFDYNTSFDKYDEFEELDNLSHRLRLSVTKDPSRNSSVQAQVGYSLTQDQGLAESPNDADLFLTPRTERETVSLDFSYRKRFRSRWEWGFAGGFRDWSFDEIEGFESDAPPTQLENRTEFSGAVTLARLLSESSAFGFSYSYRTFDLELSGEESVQAGSLVYRRQLEERLSLAVAVGGFLSTGTTAQGPGGSSDDSRSGVQGTLNLSRNWRRTGLSLVIGHTPSAGNDRLGTSTNSTLGLSLTSRATRRWNWGLSARYALRDPNDTQEPTIDTLAFGANAGARVHRALSLQLGINYTDQSSDASGNEGSFLIGRIGLNWHPLRGSRVAR